MTEVVEATIVKLTEDELKAKAAKELNKVAKLETQLNEVQLALSSDERFVNFLNLQKAVIDKGEELKKNLEKQMIDNGIKSIDIDSYGKITIVDRQDVKVVDESLLPRKFFKKSIDQAKLNQEYKLKEKLPEGTEINKIQYIKMTPKKEKK